MKSIITGLNGTVAPFVAEAMTKQGATIIPWNRTIIPTDNETQIRAFIQQEQPTYFLHIATGSPGWAATAAKACHDFNIKFLFTSSVSVYAWKQVGPFTVEDIPHPDDDYGRYKLECEQKIRAANKNAYIVRLGWQIGRTHTGNHMLAHLHNQKQENGRIQASTNWYPACSFLWDTAEALTQIIQHHPPGLYHLDSNDGHTFHEIVQVLNHLHGNPWHILPTTDHTQNNRLLDPRIPLKTLSQTLFQHQSKPREE